MPTQSSPQTSNRLGFHYYPDSLHYQERDLHAWLPELVDLGAAWLTLVAPIERAIPEFFLNSLIVAGIQPILHFRIPPTRQISDPDRLRPLFRSYARWGVRAAALFDRPNLRSVWPAQAWAQGNLVEQFLDLYLPVAQAASEEGLTPIFSPLEPGGDYWDLAFLRAALRSLERRGSAALLERFTLGAYALAGNRDLSWGSGGPERWPMARPYHTPQGVQDQRGFHIFDWYQAVVQSELGSTRPIFLLKAGCRLGDQTDRQQPPVDPLSHARRNLALAHSLFDEETPEVGDRMPAEVKACSFWLLTAAAGSPEAGQAWFQDQGSQLPAVAVFKAYKTERLRVEREKIERWREERISDEAGSPRRWREERISDEVGKPGQRRGAFPGEELDEAAFANGARPGGRQNARPAVEGKGLGASFKGLESDFDDDGLPPDGAGQPIQHYLLLPVEAWDAPGEYLKKVAAFIQDCRPTLGIAPEEAALARRVTLFGGPQAFPPQVLDELNAAGCSMDYLFEGSLKATSSNSREPAGNGIDLATR